MYYSFSDYFFRFTFLHPLYDIERRFAELHKQPVLVCSTLCKKIGRCGAIIPDSSYM